MIGSTFATSIAPLGTGSRRESAILSAFLNGQAPQSLVSRLYPVTVSQDGHTLTYYVTGDYLGIGDESDFLRTPMFPGTAQAIADYYGAILPTTKMVDQIYAASTVRGSRHTYDSPRDTTARYVQSNNAINADLGPGVKSGLVGGIKKDLVITPTMDSSHVYIYGWQGTNGVNQQPLYGGHGSSYVDYSHGVRLISKQAILDGSPVDITTVLASPTLYRLISTARIANARHPAGPPAPAAPTGGGTGGGGTGGGSTGGGGTGGGSTGGGGTGGGGTGGTTPRPGPTGAQIGGTAAGDAGFKLGPVVAGAVAILGVLGIYASTRR